jgi:hypothetical protein
MRPAELGTVGIADGGEVWLADGGRTDAFLLIRDKYDVNL